MRRALQRSSVRPSISTSSTWPLHTSAALKQRCRSLANVKHADGSISEVWFTSSPPLLGVDKGGNGDLTPPDERTLKLGKTIRILHERLPTLLASPLPQEILSPQITLYLFPSTHPHLPTVSGRIAYTAALWTAPVAWGRVPVVGNVKLVILSERMFKNGSRASHANIRNERLVVRWKTCGKDKGGAMGALYRSILRSASKDGLGKAPEDDGEFSGLFIFEFDEEGRIISHTIEHADEGGNWDKMTRVISVTDWLLGKAWGKRMESTPGLALGYCEADEDHKSQRPSGRIT